MKRYSPLITADMSFQSKSQHELPKTKRKEAGAEDEKEALDRIIRGEAFEHVEKSEMK
jgi:hypothetical protein